MDCTHIREALSARLDGEDPGVDGHRVNAHVSACAACAAWTADLSALHRMMRVRAAEEVPDLTAAILANTPSSAVERGSGRAHPGTATGWILLVVALAGVALLWLVARAPRPATEHGTTHWVSA